MSTKKGRKNNTLWHSFKRRELDLFADRKNPLVESNDHQPLGSPETATSAAKTDLMSAGKKSLVLQSSLLQMS